MPFRLTAGLITIAMLTGTTCPITPTPSEFPKTVAWGPHTVNTGAAVRPTVVEVFDFDGDNKQDVVAGYAGLDAQLPAVFIFFQADVNTFTAVQLASSADLSGVTALAVADIDGDTHRDVVVACNGRLQYLHSPADPRQSSGWMMSTINQSSGTGIGQWSDVAVNTIDGATNGPDLVASNQNAGRLSWFKSPGPSPADGTGWLRTDIDAATRANAAGVAIADFNADTRLDVISTAPGEGGGAAPRLAWYKNPADPVADTWEKHAIGDLPSATRVILADLDADGRSDVISINGPGRQVAWYDRPTDATTDWPGFLITQFTTNTPIDVKAADIDGNNQLDLVVATQNANTLRWFTPAPGHVQTDQWIENNLRDLEGIPSRIALGDMDGDGRSDVVVPLQGQTTAQDSIIWFENPEP